MLFGAAAAMQRQPGRMRKETKKQGEIIMRVGIKAT
ncbi:hypothetical protein BOSP111201_04695 [Bordetella sputigena]